MTVKPNPKTIETLKTVVIAVLVTGILAFVAGMKYQANTNSQVHSQAKALASVQSKQ